jgi:hypothetical protein
MSEINGSLISEYINRLNEVVSNKRDFVIFEDKKTGHFIQYSYGKEKHNFLLNIPNESYDLSQINIIINLLSSLGFQPGKIGNLEAKQYAIDKRNDLFANCGREIMFIAELTEKILSELLKTGVPKPEKYTVNNPLDFSKMSLKEAVFVFMLLVAYVLIEYEPDLIPGLPFILTGLLVLGLVGFVIYVLISK